MFAEATHFLFPRQQKKHACTRMKSHPFCTWVCFMRIKKRDLTAHFKQKLYLPITYLCIVYNFLFLLTGISFRVPFVERKLVQIVAVSAETELFGSFYGLPTASYTIAKSLAASLSCHLLPEMQLRPCLLPNATTFVLVLSIQASKFLNKCTSTKKMYFPHYFFLHNEWLGSLTCRFNLFYNRNFKIQQRSLNSIKKGPRFLPVCRFAHLELLRKVQNTKHRKGAS